MSLPEPRPGLIIRYSFLWSEEYKLGALEGFKDRPCAIVVAVKREDGEVLTIVAPITHSSPKDNVDSIEIPPQTCRSLGLDDGRHWLRCDELNRFLWPGYDLRPRPDRAGMFDYGMLPQPLFEQLKAKIIERQLRGKVRVSPRT